MHRAIFLDRDGIINETVERDGKRVAPRTLEEFKIIDGVKAALFHFQKSGFLNIVVTNQPDIARGFSSADLLSYMHMLMKSTLHIDDILTCIHDDSDKCECRKPKPGLLFKAAVKWKIDLSDSIMIGDTWRDMAAGKAAGCTTVLIEYPFSEIECDYRTTDLESIWRLL